MTRRVTAWRRAARLAAWLAVALRVFMPAGIMPAAQAVPWTFALAICGPGHTNDAPPDDGKPEPAPCPFAMLSVAAPAPSPAAPTPLRVGWAAWQLGVVPMPSASRRCAAYGARAPPVRTVLPRHA